MRPPSRTRVLGQTFAVKPDAVVEKAMPRNWRREIWEAPALYNRHVRRAAGLLSRFWRWDSSPETRRTFVPRYIRRHFDADHRVEIADSIPYDEYGSFTHPKTRRQRRHRARILAISKRSGL